VHTLQKALVSLQGQPLALTDFEIIVVDNGSTDNTRALVSELKKETNNIHYCFENRPGLHVGRHLGARLARGEILSFIDDDVEVFPTWLEGIIDSFQDNSIKMAGGKNLPKFEQLPPRWILEIWNGDSDRRILDVLSILDLGDEVKLIDPLLVFGCNFSIRKSVLLEAGGFHPDGMPRELVRYRGDGETHVARHLKGKSYHALYHPKASVYHMISSNRMTEEYFKQRSFLQGISDSYTSIRSHRKNMRIYFKFLKYLVCSINSGARITTKMQGAYFKGYMYHRNQVKRDPSLFQWVMREDYREQERRDL
jgi:glycosyltransferase involved in cell wall biosynthesis